MSNLLINIFNSNAYYLIVLTYLSAYQAIEISELSRVNELIQFVNGVVQICFVCLFEYSNKGVSLLTSVTHPFLYPCSQVAVVIVKFSKSITAIISPSGVSWSPKWACLPPYISRLLSDLIFFWVIGKSHKALEL